jgi:hypothetical protein
MQESSKKKADDDFRIFERERQRLFDLRRIKVQLAVRAPEVYLRSTK